ncbi:MAG: hypothetical protein WA816_11175 [Bacteroidales bacterium]
MKELIISIFVVLILISCTKEILTKSAEDLSANTKGGTPCANLVDGVYQYPKSDSGTINLFEYDNLPEEICNCITTEGLVETCLNYPDWVFITFEGKGFQSGYEVLRNNFRGFKALEKRSDAANVLITKYKLTDPYGYDSTWSINQIGSLNLKLYYMTIFLGQDSIIKKETKEEKTEIIPKFLFRYNNFLEHEQDSVFPLYLRGAFFTIARMMYFDNYQPFIVEYNKNVDLQNAIKYSGTIDNPSLKQLIISWTKDYLTVLNSK